MPQITFSGLSVQECKEIMKGVVITVDAPKSSEPAVQASNSDYTAALLRIRNIVRGSGDSVTKMGKVGDVFAGLNLPKAEDCA